MEEFFEVIATAGWLAILFLTPLGILKALTWTLDIYTEWAHIYNL